jgi:uncharacterized RDD family membrane protein YckC/DNA-directed RNA polymerase subunit RPC12/RpoP
MAWYYAVDGVSHGPVEEAQIRALHQQNVVTTETPVWTEGMAEWLPFQSSTLAAASGAVATLSSAPTHKCAECGKMFPEDEMIQYEQSWVCAACKPVFFQRIKEGVAPMGTLVFATVGKRFLAVLIDGLIIVTLIFVPIFGLSMLLALSAKSDGSNAAGAMVWFLPVMIILEYGLPAAFEIFFIGRYGATPGKMLMRIKVVTPEGGRVSYGRATGRYFGKMLSGIILYIGFLMAFWDEEKRALHDRICKTRVIVTG